MDNFEKSNATVCSQDQEIIKLVPQQFFQQIKSEVMRQWQIWKNDDSPKYTQIHEKRADYLTECYEIFLRAMMLNSNYEINLKDLTEQTKPKINFIDNVIIDYLLLRTDDHSLSSSIYNWLWLSMLNEIWSEFLSGIHKIINNVMQNESKNIYNILSDFMQQFEEQKEQQPIFSSDSQNEEQKIIEPRKKYSSYSLFKLLGNHQVKIFQQTLSTLQTQSRNKLLKNLNEIFKQPSKSNEYLLENQKK